MASDNSAAPVYAPVDHPGILVPRRRWSLSWPEYAPVNITPPDLRPAGLAGLAASVAAGWAEPYADPTDVPDWPARQARALVPFDLDDAGRPLNPWGRTGRTGRDLGAWGENQRAEALVFAGDGAERRILLLRQGWTGRWVMPQAVADPGETAVEAAARELREAACVYVDGCDPHLSCAGYAFDRRSTDHAWVCDVFAHYQLPDDGLSTAGPDTADAVWWPAPDITTLRNALAPHGGLYEVDAPLIAVALDVAAGTLSAPRG